MFGHPTLNRLSRGVDGALAPKAREALKRHLELCAACQVREGALAQVRTVLRGLVPIEESGWVSKPPLVSPSIFNPLLKLRKWIVPAGLGGLVLVIGLLFLKVPQPVLRVVSSGSNMAGSESEEGSQIPSGTALRTLPLGQVDLELPGQLLLRLKPGTTLTWQQVDRPLFARKPMIVVNLMRGELLARTKESFWGSQLVVRTPSASAFVKGTAFSLKVDPWADSTTLKVAAGSVFFSPNLNQVGLEVKAGQKSRIQSEHMPASPEPISTEDWKHLLETYQIGEEPWAALVIGGGSERVEELFRPSLLYLSMWTHPQIQSFLRKAVREMNAAILQGDFSGQEGNLRILEMALNDISDQEIAVPFRLFAGACAVRLGQMQGAYGHFSSVAHYFPNHPLASLSLAAIAATADKLHNPSIVYESYQKILDRYPKSPEAVLAREYFQKHHR